MVHGRIPKRTKFIKRVADIITACVTGEMRMGKYTGCRMRATRYEIAQLAYRPFESRGPGRAATALRIGCVPNTNSSDSVLSSSTPGITRSSPTLTAMWQMLGSF
jgi:hypothetical protein